MNTSIKVLLYTSKTLSNNEHPIMLRIIKDRKPKYISVGYSCITELWDKIENLPKKKHPHYKELKILIAKKIVDTEKLLLDLENDDKNLTSYELKGKIKKKKVNNPYVIEYFDNVIERFILSGQIKNSEVYKDAKRNLLHFIGSKKIHFSDIDILFLNQLEEYLKSTGKGENG